MTRKNPLTLTNIPLVYKLVQSHDDKPQPTSGVGASRIGLFTAVGDENQPLLLWANARDVGK